MTALMYAIYYGHDDIVEILSHYESNIQDNEGRTALMIAAGRNRVESCKFLLNEFDFVCNKGLTALDYAIQYESTDVIRLLLPLSKQEKF